MTFHKFSLHNLNKRVNEFKRFVFFFSDLTQFCKLTNGNNPELPTARQSNYVINLVALYYILIFTEYFIILKGHTVNDGL